MKSFTRNQTNLQALAADRRFDVLVKKQAVEQQHVLVGNQKEMQVLRDNLKICMEKFQAVSERTESNLADFKEKAINDINLLKEKIRVQENTISDQKKSIQSFQDQLLNFQGLYSSLRDVDKAKKEIEALIGETTKNHLCSLQDLQRECKALINSLTQELGKFKEKTDKSFWEQSNRIDARFNENKLDREGVLREIRIREKELFIIEKKIENIYTLIERINKKGELCRKPE